MTELASSKPKGGSHCLDKSPRTTGQDRAAGYAHIRAPEWEPPDTSAVDNIGIDPHRGCTQALKRRLFEDAARHGS